MGAHSPSPPAGQDWLTTSTILDGLRDFENASAWDAFVRRFRRPIISFARKVGLPEAEAEDVAQESLLAFAQEFRNGRYVRERGRLSRWLFGIAYRQMLRQRERLARGGGAQNGMAGHTTFWQQLPDEPQATTAWDDEWEGTLWRECIERARCEFQPSSFEAFVLVVRGDCTPAEAAGKLGLPVKTVYNAKHRLLKRIRELRDEYECAAAEP